MAACSWKQRHPRMRLKPVNGLASFLCPPKLYAKADFYKLVELSSTKDKATLLPKSSGRSRLEVRMVTIVVNSTVYTGNTKAEAWAKASADQKDRNSR